MTTLTDVKNALIYMERSCISTLELTKREAIDELEISLFELDVASQVVRLVVRTYLTGESWLFALTHPVKA